MAADPVEGKMCGGIAALPCPADHACADDPNDDCDPARGADCAGICVACADPGLGRQYVSEDAEQCATIRFRCDDGERPFSDECGCGCEPAG